MTIMIDVHMYKKLRMLQAKAIVKENKTVSFSSIIHTSLSKVL